ncbi:hypothetical protein [Ruminococcus sp. zg-924]|nr:hypothetical protein [Ruminococcus sp. zg-924]
MKRERLCLDCGCYFTISLGEIKKLKAKGNQNHPSNGWFAQGL